MRNIAGLFLLAALAVGLVLVAGGGESRAAPGEYTYTFDGSPASPTSAYWMEDFDVQVHVRAYEESPDKLMSLPMDHGPMCQGPPAQHHESNVEDAVFFCRDHVMTAIDDGGYGVIYLTPDRMLDWSDGEAVLRFDVSTQRLGTRDWWDVWLTPFDRNLALPIEDFIPDLQGQPIGDFIRTRMETFHYGPGFKVQANGKDVANADSWAGYREPFSRSLRETFELRVHSGGSKLDFCMIGRDNGFLTGDPKHRTCWAKDAPIDVDFTQAVVQLGHHTYNPAKEGVTGNTWHWDNVYMSDSMPFTMIRANERYVQSGETITFSEPAPANAYLRFSAKGSVKIDGKPVARQESTRLLEGHFDNYFVPIPEGTTSVVYEGGDRDWWSGRPMAKDIAIWSQGAEGGAAPTQTPFPPSPTPTRPAVTATATPTVATPTPNATPTATPTEVCHEAIFRNGVLEQGPEVDCPDP